MRASESGTVFFGIAVGAGTGIIPGIAWWLQTSSQVRVPDALMWPVVLVIWMFVFEWAFLSRAWPNDRRKALARSLVGTILGLPIAATIGAVCVFFGWLICLANTDISAFGDDNITVAHMRISEESDRAFRK